MITGDNHAFKSCEADVVVSPKATFYIFTVASQPTPHQSKIRDFCQLLLKEKPLFDTKASPIGEAFLIIHIP